MVMPSPPPDSSGQLPEDPPEPRVYLDEVERQRRAQLLTSKRLHAAVAKIARCHGVPEDDVEDIVQETLRRALHANLPQEEGEASMYTSGIAANVSRDHMEELRVRGGEQSYAEEGDEGGLLPIEAAAQPAYFEDREVVERIVEAGRERFPRTFPWFVQARVDGETSEDIGNDHGVSPGLVRRKIVDVHRFVVEYGQKLGVAVALLIVIVFGAYWLRRSEELGETATYVPRRVEPAPLDADQLRERASKELAARQWQACVDDLDAADKMDPVGAARYLPVRAAAEYNLKVHEVPRGRWYGPAKQ
jgi:DNA-directed RNA polymerase specialized sigma24 family protein